MDNYSTGFKQGKRDAIDGLPAKPIIVDRRYRDGYYDGYDKHERKR